MKNNYSIQENKILNICRNDYKYFLSKDNVVGVGLGYKIKSGFNTFRKCIKVFVTKKVPEAQLYSGDIIPEVYMQNETDVVESGRIKAYELTARVRPVVGGYSTSSSRGDQHGTMGCLVEDSENMYFLGCNHVFTLNQTNPLGIPIVQPANADGGVTSRDTVGNLYKYIPVKYTTKQEIPLNYCDCAIAKVISKSITSPNIALIGKIMGTNIARLNEHVQKVGRTTEYTVGNVMSFGGTIEVEYKKGYVTLVNQIITNNMAHDGDSGAVLFNFNKQAVGILVAGCNLGTIFSPIQAVLNSLNVSIVR